MSTEAEGGSAAPDHGADPTGGGSGHAPGPDRAAGSNTDVLLAARADALHDLAARELADPAGVDVVEDAVAGRRWWLAQWPPGAPMIAGLVAQDVQDALLDAGTRWPACDVPGCPVPAVHTLAVRPELGPHPHWVCENAGAVVSDLGSLPSGSGSRPGGEPSD